MTIDSVDIAPAQTRSLNCEAICVARHIDVKTLQPRLASGPVLVALGDNTAQRAAVFRYGAVVFFGVPRADQQRFLTGLAPHFSNPYDKPERETLTLVLDPQAPEGIVASQAVLNQDSIDRLQLVAEVLARCVVLSQYEVELSTVFNEIEPFAQDLRLSGRSTLRARRLLQAVGRTLLIQHQMVGRVEVSEKPELLWERPELERLFLRLEDEFELRERDVALERKLALVSHTVQTLLELLHNRRSLRVEWYIVLLIVVEIVLSVYSIVRGLPH